MHRYIKYFKPFPLLLYKESWNNDPNTGSNKDRVGVIGDFLIGGKAGLKTLFLQWIE